jgi:ketosteroid isomerase-like protein
MNDQNQLHLVQQVYSNFKNGDIDALLPQMSEDIEWELPQIENVPFSGKRRGKEMVRDFFTTLMTGQEPLEFNPKEFIAQNDKVVALGHYEWKTSDGHQFGGDFAHVFTVRDGLVTRFQEYMDTESVAAAYRKSSVVL